MEELNNAENEMGSPIQEFFRNKNVFITGATGFMGKVLVEKLLYSCPHINNLYLLIRSKKNKECQQRIQEYLEDVVFSRLDEKARLKVVALPGDISKPSLGLSEEHRKLLKESVHVVFHAAATVRFDEPLPVAVAINVSGTKEMIELAKEMKNLKTFVHVSTAFSNCHRREIEERVYDAPIEHENIITLTKCLHNDTIEKITPVVLDKYPNTYVYTKSVAEEIVKTSSKGIPVCIFRPAIVVASYLEPLPGWVNNLYGATGVIVGCGTGVLRTLNCDKKVIANIVPADLTTNAIIASAWKTAVHANNSIEDANHNEPAEMPKPAEILDDGSIPVYNYVSSVEKPIVWEKFMDLANKHGADIPTPQAIWCICLTLHRSWLLHKIYAFFLHFIPALIMDSVASLFGKRTNMITIYNKINKFSDVLAYFTTRNWTFKNDNVQNLWLSLSPQDKMIFPFDMSSLDWDKFFYNYVRGIREYVLKDDMSSVEYAKTKLRRFEILHKGLKLLILFLLLKFFWMVFTTIFT